jgi:hypothetical protein
MTTLEIETQLEMLLVLGSYGCIVSCLLMSEICYSVVLHVYHKIYRFMVYPLYNIGLVQSMLCKIMSAIMDLRCRCQLQQV